MAAAHDLDAAGAVGVATEIGGKTVSSAQVYGGHFGDALRILKLIMIYTHYAPCNLLKRFDGWCGDLTCG